MEIVNHKIGKLASSKVTNILRDVIFSLLSADAAQICRPHGVPLTWICRSGIRLQPGFFQCFLPLALLLHARSIDRKIRRDKMSDISTLICNNVMYLLFGVLSVVCVLSSSSLSIQHAFGRFLQRNGAYKFIILNFYKIMHA